MAELILWMLRTAPSGSRLSGTSTHVHHGRDNPTPPRCGVISAVVEKELGERNVGFDSLKSRLNRYMEEEGAKSTSTCVEVHMSFLRRSVVPTSRRMRTSPAGGVPYDERSEQQSIGEMKRGRGGRLRRRGGLPAKPRPESSPLSRGNAKVGSKHIRKHVTSRASSRVARLGPISRPSALQLGLTDWAARCS